jgi:hypothetical protein
MEFDNGIVASSSTQAPTAKIEIIHGHAAGHGHMHPGNDVPVTMVTLSEEELAKLSEEQRWK